MRPFTSILDRVRYPGAPRCAAPVAPAAAYVSRWQEARNDVFPAVDAYETSCGAAIDQEWFHQLGLQTQVVIKPSRTCYQHGRLLYAALARYARERCGHQLNIVDTGTARGFSALCLARALADAGATGKIASFDVLPHETPMFWNGIHDADGPRSRAQLLAPYAGLVEPYVIFHRGNSSRTLQRIAFPRVHFAFLDSVHTYDHVMAEFAAVGPRQRAGDILFFDDYTPRAYAGVVRAADEICRVHGYAPAVVAASAERQYLIAEKQ
jgi:hypothetical protein